MESEVAESFISQFSLLDYAIVISLIGLSTYWFMFRKKANNEFDASSIKSFSLE